MKNERDAVDRIRSGGISKCDVERNSRVSISECLTLEEVRKSFPMWNSVIDEVIGDAASTHEKAITGLKGSTRIDVNGKSVEFSLFLERLAESRKRHSKRTYRVLLTELANPDIVMPIDKLSIDLEDDRHSELNKTIRKRIDQLIAAADLFPSPTTRKLLKKVIADQAYHIDDLLKAGRYKTAKWIWFSTWPLLLWYGAKDLILGVAKVVRGWSAS